MPSLRCSCAWCCWSTPRRFCFAGISALARSGDMKMPEKKIEVQDLYLSYGPKEVIHGISFAIYQNEILGVIGPAQSGKTSLVRCINRTIEFTANSRMRGTIRVDGENVQEVRNVYELRRKIGMVAPLPVGLPLSIYDNVAFAPRAAGMRNKSELDALVEKCLRQSALWDEVKD